ncbi:GNAT family N-acetyltransferase [Sphingomonas sp.]|uniref:GNAT family N-acetyltransferase n=1 Tax=Sphingomonas sp. TaxID=28214 RepID=UPI001B1687DE|nr:GNAT family N-acetyltransferase [Sphingomonas sp.]MBO9714851.1 GNAT family N-acetyltransferase [Sphingomonas sp.]
MSKLLPLDRFTRLMPVHAVDCGDGLAAAIDAAADAAPATHRFLRYAWYAAALEAYGGAARTLTVSREGRALVALPMVRMGNPRLGLWQVPGSYWPFRGFPAAVDAGIDAFEALVARLGREVTALRIGPIHDGDPALEALKAAALARGWAVIDRFVADSWAIDLAGLSAGGDWPRASTRAQNRNKENRLAREGALDWSYPSGLALNGEVFDALATIEEKSWVAEKTDGRDTKFTARGHGRFWRAAAADPVLGTMLHAALLRLDGKAIAFVFDLDTGTLRHTIANGYDAAHSKTSPGQLLYYRNLVRSLELGVARVDCGAGDSGYKQRVGAERGPAIRDWLFVKPGLPALGAKLLRGAWRRSGHAERVREGSAAVAEA